MTQEEKSKSKPPEIKTPNEKRYLKPLLLGLAVGAVVVVAAVALEIIPLSALGLVSTTRLSVVIPAENKDDCKLKPPSGHRPLCAYTSWNQSLHQCKITDYKATTCACYEGELRSCSSTTGAPCSPLSPGTCGLKSCVVTDDTHSSWGTCSVP